MGEVENYEQSIKDKLRQKRKSLNIDYNILLKKFFIDEFLKLVSESKYNKNFIWKGGFVLSVISGIDKRRRGYE